MHPNNVDCIYLNACFVYFQHERFLHDGKVSPCDVLFIGDSLIRNMKETEVHVCICGNSTGTGLNFSVSIPECLINFGAFPCTSQSLRCYSFPILH